LEDPSKRYNARATHAALILLSNADAKATFKKLLASIAASFMVEHLLDQDQLRED
tara:strand:+ start:2206 stop:2370 length:165 start_codon:yes stop_codon:yes gene_type:complete